MHGMPLVARVFSIQLVRIGVEKFSRARTAAEHAIARLDRSAPVHDGEHFPAEAREVQWTDVAPYTSTVPAFWTTPSPRANDLEDVLKGFARTVAKMIHDAPKFEPDWPVVEAPGGNVARIELARL